MPQAQVEARSGPRVLIAVETWWANGRKVIDGITRYAQQHTPWTFLHGTLPDLRASTIRYFAPRCDGIIVEAWQPHLLEAAKAAGKPTVLAYHADGAEAYPRVRDDSTAIATLAFEHFRDRGFTHFAYCGNPQAAFSSERFRVFDEHVRAGGGRCHAYQSELAWLKPDRWQIIHEQIGAWARDLPKPVGLFAANSHIGRIAITSCREAGLLVPEEVAVLGVGDDEIVCNLTDPPMSAVDSAGEQVGFEAARLMDRVLTGQPVEPAEVLVPPTGVTVRRSTDTLALDEPDLVAALRLIREQACDGLRVKDVLREVPCSRRKLERGFAAQLGRSLHQELLRVRIERAKQLLIDSDLVMPEIAVRCGFEYPTHLTAVFKRQTGVTPRQFRKRHSGAGGA
jgi:LacI family transcriptional regulator